MNASEVLPGCHSNQVIKDDGYLVLDVASGSQLKCQQHLIRTSNGCFLQK